ncbi:MAG: ATP-binding protein [Lachnospiraceae bacterium]|nr:ATP-binding protein [Lachnospiraceae bacterium]
MKDMTIKAETENLHAVFDFVVDGLMELQQTPTFIRQCKLSAEEVFLNICSYSYESEIGSVYITRDIVNKGSDKEVVISFSDSGIPFNPLTADDPDLTAELEDRQIGGLGIFLVKELMDEVSYEYEDGHNILTMKKALEK